MCGRYVMARATSDLVPLFEIEVVGSEVAGPQHEIFPTNDVPIVVEPSRDGTAERRLEAARWSLVPSYSKTLTLKYPTFNARIETVMDKPTFRGSTRTKRALLPFDSFFEWKSIPGQKRKQRHTISPPDPNTVAFAGLYSWWKDHGDDSWVLTATMLTRDATGPLTELHHRAPVVVDRAQWDDWLDVESDPVDELFEMISEVSAELMAEFSVAPSTGYDGQ